MAKGKQIKPSAAEAMTQFLAERGMTMEQMMAEMGLTAVAKGTTEKPVTRSANRDAWLSPTKKELDEEEALAIKQLPEVIGSAAFLEGPGELSQEQIDGLMTEALPLRKVEDVAKGRYEAIKLTVNYALDAKEGEFKNGALYSLKNNMKFTREAANDGKVVPNLEALEEILDEKTWKAITTPVTTRTVDSEKFEKAMRKGLVTDKHMKQILEIQQLKGRINVRPIKPGEVPS